MIREQISVQVVGKLNGSASKLRGDFRQSNDSRIAVRPGDANRKAHVLGRLYGISHAGSGKHVPQQGASPFVLLFALARLEAHTLCHRLESGKALERNEVRSLANTLDEESGQRGGRLA